MSQAVQISVVFFFEQKTAFEMLGSLVGSEMWIRERHCTVLLTVLLPVKCGVT